MALKACKECRKEISTDANPCPHCGKKSPHGMSGIVKYGGGFLLVMFGLPLMVSMCAGAARKQAAHASAVTAAEAPPVAAPVPPLEVGAMKLWRDYEENEVAADAMYRGRALAVQGVVSGIRKDFLDHVVVDLASPNQFMATHATMEASEASTAASLKKKSPVVVICTDVRRIVGSPMLSGCVFPR